MRIVSQSEMKSLDDKAINEIGIPSLVLMENAGLEAARLIGEDLKKNYPTTTEAIIVCGKGKNGGDGLVVARHLLTNGHRIRVFLMHPVSDYKSESQAELKILQKMKAKITQIESINVLREYFKRANPPFVVIDAILGIGIERDVEGLYFDVIDEINENATEIIALDIPSGVNGDTGKIMGTAINANTTVSFGYPKLGHFLYPGAAKRGSLYHVDLTFPPEWSQSGNQFLLSHANTAPLLHERDRFGHKNSFGHCLLIGGSPGKLGAIEMASQACLKMGTGLVTVASWEDSFPSLEVKLPSEIMNIRIRKNEDEKKSEGQAFLIPKPGLSLFTSVVVGPGLGMRSDGEALMRQLLMEFPGPIVIDADGLNLIGDFKMHDLIAKRPGQTVLTPHPGEMARLIGRSKDFVTENPLASLKEAYEMTGAVVLLKGATTLLQASDSKVWFNHYPNDGMATAGSGDVLSGMIGGFLGQKMDALEAARLGVYLHSIAGKHAALINGHRSMTARDIIGNIREGFKELRDYKISGIHDQCEFII